MLEAMSPKNLNPIIRWFSMLSYPTLKEKPRVLRALTSLDPEAFETLLIPFEQAWQAYLDQQIRGINTLNNTSAF
jgi:hypothetical protein